jgi:L-alanine-DL-glutamate epimerase-like enolase superfamily enzyme
MASIGAIDVALWYIYGRSCGEPVWRMLGGFRDSVDVYADGIGYTDRPPGDVASLVRRHAELGFGAVKIHLASDDRDAAVEKVRLSREALGTDRKLMVDAHAMWTGKQAAEMARRFAPYDLYWLEEPARYDDEPSHLKEVRAATRALIAGGESETTVAGIRRLITEGGLQVVQTDIISGGGFTGLMRIAALADAYHVPIAPHGAQYPDINCHLVAAVPNGLMIPACPDVEPYQIWSRLYKPAFWVTDGHVRMTDRPGLGLELDQGFVDRYRVDG